MHAGEAVVEFDVDVLVGLVDVPLEVEEVVLDVELVGGATVVLLLVVVALEEELATVLVLVVDVVLVVVLVEVEGDVEDEVGAIEEVVTGKDVDTDVVVFAGAETK